MYAYAAFKATISSIFTPNTTLVFGSARLDRVDYLEAIQTYKCNIISGLPKIIHNIITHPKRKKYDLSSLCMVAVGGQSITSELISLVKKDLKVKLFFVGYGSTEINSLIRNLIDLETFNPDKFQGCMGKPSAYAEAKIVNPESGKIQLFGEEGELYFRSYFMTKGYWKDDAKTRAAFDENGWFVCS
jgi:fatty-acyl-CoA synthase